MLMHILLCSTCTMWPQYSSSWPTVILRSHYSSHIYFFAELFCCVPPAPYGHNTAAVGPLLPSGLTSAATFIAFLNRSVVFHLHPVATIQQQLAHCYPPVSLQQPHIHAVYVWGLAAPQYLCSVSSTVEFNTPI